jgi:polyisoprenoid-binding protein YceI
MPMAQPGFSGVHYVMDTRLSQFTVQAFASGMISVVAHSPKIAIRDWTGEVRFEPESLKDASLVVRGKTTSFEVTDQLREDDRRQLHRVMNQEVLEVTAFPEFVFESTAVTAEKQKQDLYRVNVIGKLTLHGVTNGHSFYAQVAFGADSFRAYGDFTLSQTDYAIKVASIAGGTLKLQDELKCSFYVVAKAKANE